MTLDELAQRFDDLVAAVERIADTLEALEVLLRNVAAQEAVS